MKYLSMQVKNVVILFLTFLLSFTIDVSAQSVITGIVRDAITNEPVLGVSVIIKELQKGAITDSEGSYSVSVPNDTYTVIFSSIVYKSLQKQVNCNKDEVVLNVELQPTSVQMDEVVVIGKSKAREIREQAMPISVISMEELQGTVSDISDIISKTSGVKIKTSGGVGSATKISVRGLEGKRIGFFIDETPLSDNSEFIDINDIPTDFIERIEIYKGIVPAKLGGSAIGGAVNIVLKELPPTYLNASYVKKSFNEHKANFVYKRNQNGIEAGVGGSYTYSDNNYKMQIPKEFEEFGVRDVIRDHDKFKKTTVSGGLISKKWWFDEVAIEPVIILSEKEIQGIEYNIQEAKSFSNAYILSNIFEKINFFTEGLDFSFQQNYAYTSYKFYDKSMFTYNWDGSIKDTVFLTDLGIGEGEIGQHPNDTHIQKHHYYQKINLNYVLDERNSVNFNSMYRYVNGKPDDKLKDAVIGYETDFNSVMNSWVGGLSYEFNSLNKKFSNMINAKFYYYSMQTKLVEFGDETYTPIDVDNTKKDFGISEALRFRFTPQFLFKSSIAYDVRMPSDNELLGDGFLIEPAGNLNPERNTSINIGFMYDVTDKRQNRYQLEINVFYMYLQDMIRFTGGLLQSKYQNFGEMRTLGAEIEIKADATHWLYVWGNATYQDVRDVRKHAANSKAPNPTYMDRIPNIPFLYANVGIELHKANLFGGKGQNSRLFSDCSFVEEYFYDFEMSIHQERRIPRSLTFNIGAEQSFGNQSIFISMLANNLTDAKVYSEFNRPLPGRKFGIKLRYILK